MATQLGEDNIPCERYRPLASPKAPITDDQNRPVSIISTSARSAKVVAAPPSPTKSVNTEIYEDNPNRTIDRFDERSSSEGDGNHRDLGRFEAVSFYSNDSQKGWPPQSKSSGLSISQPIIVASSTGFGMSAPEIGSKTDITPHHNPHQSDVSIQSSDKSHRFSTLEVDDSVQPRNAWTGMRNVGQAITTDLPSPAENPDGNDRHASISPLPSRGSTIRRSFGRGLLNRPHPPSADPGGEESNALREVGGFREFGGSRDVGGFRLPFLHGMPKFLRQSAKSSLTPSEEKGVKDAVQPLGSFFHDGSSDGEPGEEESQIGDAQQAVVGTPVMVEHGSKTKVGLKEMLHTKPLPQDSQGPLNGKSIRVMEEHGGISRDGAFPVRKPSKREGVIGMPQQEQQDLTSENQEDQVASGIFQNTNPFAHDALRSHPVSPTHQSASAPPQQPKRTVSFPPTPPHLDIRPQHRFLRQDIVSTPYPAGFQGRGTSLYNLSEHGTMPAVREAPKSLLTLVLYSHGDSTSKVKKIVIPTPPETALVDGTDGKKPPIKATLRRDFDDEKLFKLIRSEYNSMRGSLRRLASARTMRSMNLLAYHSTSELVSKHAKPMHFRHHQDSDEHLAEARMLHLFRKPKLGRRHHEWVEWVTTLPENSTVEPTMDNERIALELVEGWSTSKFLAAVVAVLVCSLTITLLWVFIGTGGDALGFESSNVTFPGGLSGSNAATVESPIGYRGAGGRVETGVALGILVLMFGWTGIGAWILLNWLVM